MNRKLYNEISNTHLFEMEHGAFMNQATLFLTHYRGLEAGGHEQDVLKDNYLLTASTGFNEKVFIGDAGYIRRWEQLDDSDVVINVLHVSGVLMRNSVCTYGSIELRRKIIEAADCKQCIGQIFVVDTPGGSSFAKYDLLEAMDYAKSKGQELVMYIDGMACSAGMAWAAMCHKRYARNEHCMLGCMGTFASFYTNKDKDVNTVTQAMFHEIYATESPLKNRAERDAADGNYERYQREVDKNNEQYLEIIRKGIPNVTAEQLQGEVYEASEVIGTLCDGICSFRQVVDEMLAGKGFRMNAPEGSMRAASASPEGMMEKKKRCGEEVPGKEDPDDGDPDDGDPDEPGDPNNPVDPEAPDDEDPDKEPDDDDEKPTNKSHKNMSKKYEKIQQALEVESLESNKDNSLWLHEDLADKLEAALSGKEKAEMSLEAKAGEIKNLNEKIKQLNEQHASELKEAAGKAEAEMLELQKSEADKAQLKLDECQKRLDEVVAERDELKAKLEKAEKDLEELSGQPAAQNQPEVPQDMGTKAEGTRLPHTFETVKEQREAKLKFMEEIRARKK